MNNKWRFTNNELKYLKKVIITGDGSGTFGNFNNQFEKLLLSYRILFFVDVNKNPSQVFFREG